MECWTDGSALDGVKDGGGGALLIYRDGSRIEKRRPAGRHSSSYRAELSAVLAALEKVREDMEDGRRIESVRILTDSRSSIQRLAAGPLSQKDQLSARIWETMARITPSASIEFQWMPSHCGVDGNERADELANEARREPQEEVSIDYQTAKAKIKRCTRGMFPRHGRTGRGPTKGNRRSRWEECTWNQLQAGECSLTRVTLYKYGKLDSPLCPTCGEEDDIDHMLRRCAEGTGAREQLFGLNPTPEDFWQNPNKTLELLRRMGRSSGIGVT